MQFEHLVKEYFSYILGSIGNGQGLEMSISLLILSTTTKNHSFALGLGSPSMKSIEMSDHTLVGMGRGCCKPGYFTFALSNR